MNRKFEVQRLQPDEETRLQRVFDDLFALSGSSVPSVRSAARAALALVAQARNGQALAYDLYTGTLPASIHNE